MQTESKNHHVYNIFKKVNTGESDGPLFFVLRDVREHTEPAPLGKPPLHQKQHWRAGKQTGESVCNLPTELCLKGRNKQCRWVAERREAGPSASVPTGTWAYEKCPAPDSSPDSESPWYLLFKIHW